MLFKRTLTRRNQGLKAKKPPFLTTSIQTVEDDWIWPTTISVNFGGSEEARTLYLIVANDALSQVSYRPIA